MSNIDTELDKDPILQAAGDLRDGDIPEMPPVNDPMAQFVKPKIHVDQVAAQEMEGVFTPEQVIALAKAIEHNTRKAVRESVYDSTMDGQVLRKDVTPITDFSKLSIDDVYDLSVPIEAKEFMSADALTIHLKDTNYEARWVNKNSQNLGNKIAKGFTYITPSDLQDGSEPAIKASKDAQGHYVFDDVVAMKIDKATYYKALRAAHLRAVATTDQANARKRAANSANAFMTQSDAGSDFRRAQVNKKILFYDPDISV